MKTNLLKDGINPKTPPLPSLPVAYENEVHRLTQLRAYELAKADEFHQSALTYWILAQKELSLEH